LYIITAKGATQFNQWRERSLAVLHQINRALLASPEPIPNIEFSFIVNDRSGSPKGSTLETHWSFARQPADPEHERIWLIPDFNYWSWRGIAGSFADYQRQVSNHDIDIAEKDKRIIWRGNLDVNPAVRGALLEKTDNKDWADVRALNWGNKTDIKLHRLSMVDHCRYAFTAHTEGTLYSYQLLQV